MREIAAVGKYIWGGFFFHSFLFFPLNGRFWFGFPLCRVEFGRFSLFRVPISTHTHTHPPSWFCFESITILCLSISLSHLRPQITSSPTTPPILRMYHYYTTSSYTSPWGTCASSYSSIYSIHLCGRLALFSSFFLSLMAFLLLGRVGLAIYCYWHWFLFLFYFIILISYLLSLILIEKKERDAWVMSYIKLRRERGKN